MVKQNNDNNIINTFMDHKKIDLCDSCLVCNKVDSIKKMNDENRMHKNFLSCPEQLHEQPLTFICTASVLKEILHIVKPYSPKSSPRSQS